MLSFVLTAAALIALALGFVLPPLLRRAELAPGSAPAHTTLAVSSRWLAISLLVLVPLLSLGLYARLGHPGALQTPLRGLGPSTESVGAPATTAATAPGADAGEATRPGAGPMSGEITPAQIEAMVQRLADRLKRQPDDAEGWQRLARAYETLRRFDDALQAYQQIERLRPGDADVRVEHAVTLAMARGQHLWGEPEHLLQQALAINPRHLQALTLLGSAAYERKDYSAAIQAWQRVLDEVPADNELATSIRDSIDKARRMPTVAASAPP